MDPAAPAILLVGGGEGMGPVEQTVASLAAAIGAGCQVVVICGRNAKLVAKLESRCGRGAGAGGGAGWSAGAGCMESSDACILHS